MRSEFLLTAAVTITLMTASCGAGGPVERGGAEAGVQKFAVSLQGRDVGYMTVSVEPLPSGSLLVSQSTEWSMRLMGEERDVSMDSEALTDSTLNLRRMEFRLSDGSAEIEARTVRGDGYLEHTIVSAGREATTRREFQGDYMPAFLDLAVASMDWEEGQVRSFPAFDPSSGSVSEAEVTCGGSVRADLLGDSLTAASLTVRHMGMVTEMLVHDGQIIREEESGYGMLMTRVPPGQGGEVSVDADLYDLYAVSSTPIDNPRLPGTRRFALEGDIDWSRFQLNYPPLQTFEDGVVTVTSRQPDTSVAFPVDAPELAEYLAAEPMVQSDDPAIVRLADSLTAGADDAFEAATAIGEYVDLAVVNSATVSLPSAVEVLESRRGDCNEHTVLFVALARAAGIPARTCAGIVYLRRSFGYHAWPMVWVGEWVAIDPTLQQTVADATHIILAMGDLEAQYVIAQAMGRLSVREVR